MENRDGFDGDIERVTIPDSDMRGWIEALHNSGLTQAELDAFFARMNATYAKQKSTPDIEGELAELEEQLRTEHGIRWTDEQREYMRKGVEQRWREEQEKSKGNQET